MPFRDDHDAKEERIERLERALGLLGAELDDATRRSEGLDSLRARVAELSAERAELEARSTIDWASRHWRTVCISVIAGVALTAMLAFEAVRGAEARTAQAAGIVCRTELDECQRDVGRVTSERDTARVGLTALERAHSEDLARLRAGMPARHVVLVRAHVTLAEHASWTAIGDTCLLAVGIGGASGPCEATFRCSRGPYVEIARAEFECELRTASTLGALGSPSAPALLSLRGALPDVPDALHYDAIARVLEIRGPGADPWSVRADVIDASAFDVP